MPHHLHPVSARVRLALEMRPPARAVAILAGGGLLAAGAAVPFALLAAAAAVGVGGAPLVPLVALGALAGGAVAWVGSLLAWSGLSGRGRLTVAAENIVVRHQAWLRAPLVVYRSQVASVRIGAPGRARGVANLLRPARPNLVVTFNEPKRIDGLRPLAVALVAGRRRPAGLSFRVTDPEEARDAFAGWAPPADA